MAEQAQVREAVGIFENHDQMEEAIDELLLADFDRRHISVLGNEVALYDRFKEKHVDAKKLQDDPDTPRAPHIAKEELGVGQGILVGGGIITGAVAGVIAAGAMTVPGATVTTAIVAGAGGTAVGAGLAKLLGDKYGEFFQNQVEEGGVLLWVNTPTLPMEEKAQKILKKHGARDVHVHTIPASAEIEKEHLPPARFSEAAVRLKEVQDKHQALIEKDRMLAKKLDDVRRELKQSAREQHVVSTDKAEAIMQKMQDLQAYTRDMAEEEQRILAESAAEAAGNEEQEAREYFSLVHDLQNFTANYRQEMQLAA